MSNIVLFKFQPDSGDRMLSVEVLDRDGNIKKGRISAFGLLSALNEEQKYCLLKGMQTMFFLEYDKVKNEITFDQTK
jgi:hypothetical protein